MLWGLKTTHYNRQLVVRFPNPLAPDSCQFGNPTISLFLPGSTWCHGVDHAIFRTVECTRNKILCKVEKYLNQIEKNDVVFQHMWPPVMHWEIVLSAAKEKGHGSESGEYHLSMLSIVALETTQKILETTSKSTLHHANPQQEYAFFDLLSSGSLQQYEEREF